MKSVWNLSVMLVMAAFAVTSARANDGVAGITNTGLVFGETDAIEMASEDLFLSLDEIRVAYEFRNITDDIVTLVIAFPIPPVSLEQSEYGDFAIAYDQMRDPNFMGFTVEVDGRPVAFDTEIKAYRSPLFNGEGPVSPALRYDEPGEDITAVLASYNIPVTYNLDAVKAALNALSQNQKTALAQRGIIQLADNGAIQNPAWSIGWRHYWTQEFPAGATVRISHRYKPVNPASVYVWEEDPERDADSDYSGRRQYCIDAATARAIKRVTTVNNDDGTTANYGTAFFLHYILRTANTWAGPIGNFRLTIDKGSTNRIPSLCLDGIRKTGPTRFEWSAENFSPTRDIELILIQGISE